MDLIPEPYRTAVAFLIVLGILIFIHELGHYLAARWRGVYVEKFSIGFGKTIISGTDRHGTEWSVNWIPLGGYVRLHGHVLPHSPEAVAKLIPGKTFYNKSVRDRAIIVAAGPFANFILAAVLFSALFAIAGKPYSEPVITVVQADSPAAKAGFLPDDMILRMNGSPVRSFEEVQAYIRRNAEKSMQITVRRGDAELPLTAVPSVSAAGVGYLGVGAGRTAYEPVGTYRSLWYGTVFTFTSAVRIVETLGEFITGKRDAAELGGPIKIAQMSGKVAEYGLFPLIGFIAFMSVNLGLMNLLPVPVLDGGYLVFYLIETVRGRPVSERMMNLGMRAGMAAMMLLMCFTTLNDLAGAGLFSWISGLIR